jgi:hypothetical protein
VLRQRPQPLIFSFVFGLFVGAFGSAASLLSCAIHTHYVDEAFTCVRALVKSRDDGDVEDAVALFELYSDEPMRGQEVYADEPDAPLTGATRP